MRHIPFTGIFGVLLAAMVIGQTASFDAFSTVIQSYGVANAATSNLIALLIIGLEAVGALGALTPQFARGVRREAILCGVAVAIFWTFLALQALVRGITVENCGCFGAYFPQPLSWSVIVQDIIFIGLGFAALWQAQREYSNNS
jgi:hypothetical protein